MREQLEQRLQGLRAEFAKGEQLLTAAEAKRVDLRESLLRSSGAILVLEEELGKNSQLPNDSLEIPGPQLSEDVQISRSGN